MSTTAILVLAVVALLAWTALLDAVKEAISIRAKASTCPCRDLHSITVTPPTLTTRFGTKGLDEVQAAFGDAAATFKKGH